MSKINLQLLKMLVPFPFKADAFKEELDELSEFPTLWDLFIEVDKKDFKTEVNFEFLSMTSLRVLKDKENPNICKWLLILDQNMHAFRLLDSIQFKPLKESQLVLTKHYLDQYHETTSIEKFEANNLEEVYLTSNSNFQILVLEMSGTWTEVLKVTEVCD